MPNMAKKVTFRFNVLSFGQDVRIFLQDYHWRWHFEEELTEKDLEGHRCHFL